MIQKVISLRPEILDYLYYINIPSLLFLILLVFFPLQDINLFKKSATSNGRSNANASKNNLQK